ncbi:Spermatogenesis- and oogenesis-specific basic helix-loop-helix-containing protein 1 [Fukomys damarensis]|uniref:Spermatogenesis-and oogenesis-specific basic helix-loop-helix-containing protein 1 n=1 Tax=Fukomys damarensis TaxID=885580 RepID=A0A091CQQ3_FUKDA|nr:Spermatogenesis- and oogenesis-specific basic helix-loop-helix-containing protein 1 [Fukomys damarensis]
MEGLGPEHPGVGCGSSVPEDPEQVPGLAGDAATAKGPVLPRNVLSERERRKRISASCERLRVLLPNFDGRREDMASVLEMAVQFLRLVHSLVPVREQPHPTSSKTHEEAASRPGQAGPPTRTTTSPGKLLREVALTPAPDTRSVPGLDVEDGDCFPLSTSPQWWPGSGEARGATPGGVPARSSPVGSAEPGFLGDPVPSSEELQESSLELWSSDMDTWGLDLRDDIFTDFLAC